MWQKYSCSRIWWPAVPKNSRKKLFKKSFWPEVCVKFPNMELLVSFINTLYLTENCSLWDYVKGLVGKSSTVECCN